MSIACELKTKSLVIFLILIFILGYFAFYNIKEYLSITPSNELSIRRENVIEDIRKSKKIEFGQGDPNSYLYYIYTRKPK